MPSERWAIAVLTWNASERCWETVRQIEAGIRGVHDLVLLDNGSDEPLVSDRVRVIRSEKNHGAGGGLSVLIQHVLDQGATRILFCEDDWDLVNPPLRLEDLEGILADPGIGQIRLGVRSHRTSRKYWTYALGDPREAEASLAQQDSPFLPYPGGEYQRVRLLWSNNPFACTSETAERFLLTGWDELRMARPYLASGMMTADVVPGYFRHAGEIRARRKPGWKM